MSRRNSSSREYIADQAAGASSSFMDTNFSALFFKETCNYIELTRF